MNFAGAFASREEYAGAWPAATFARLINVRATYDPDGLFVYGLR